MELVQWLSRGASELLAVAGMQEVHVVSRQCKSFSRIRRDLSLGHGPSEDGNGVASMAGEIKDQSVCLSIVPYSTSML